MRASDPSQLFEVSGQPAGDPGRVLALAQEIEGANDFFGLAAALTFRARSVENTKSSGVLNLRISASQASGDSINAAYTCGRSPPVFRKARATRSTAAGGGSSATKCRTSLVAMKCAVAGCARQIRKHGLALALACS